MVSYFQSTPPALAATRAPARPAPPHLTITNGTLTLGGRPFRDVGVDAYELATDWGVNAGCGTMLTDAQMSHFFAALPAHTLVRFWAWQGAIALNVHSRRIDWRPIDRVFRAAEAHGDLLIVTLTSQDGSCDDQIWKGLSWYQGGYRSDVGTNSLRQRLPLTYWQYVQAIVNRYRNSPALGMWEPVGEPSATDCNPGYRATACLEHNTCNEQAAAPALRSFFDTVGQQIHTLDPGGIVGSGFNGGGQCGTSWTDYQYVGASPGIDVLSYHDYSPANQAAGGDRWNGIPEEILEANSLHKPVIAGESGIQAGPGRSCPSAAKRDAEMAARIRAQSRLGTQAFLFWNWVPNPASGCTFDLGAGDPTLSLLGGFTPGGS